MLPHAQALQQLISKTDNWMEYLIDQECVMIGSHHVLFIKFLESEINISNASFLRRALNYICADKEFDFLVANMENIMHIDSSGIGLLLAIASQVKREKVFFHNVHESVLKTLHLMDIDEYFGIYACKKKVEDKLYAQD